MLHDLTPDGRSRLIAMEKHHSFGKDLVGEIWELEL